MCFSAASIFDSLMNKLVGASSFSRNHVVPAPILLGLPLVLVMLPH